MDGESTQVTSELMWHNFMQTHELRPRSTTDTEKQFCHWTQEYCFQTHTDFSP